MARPVTARRPRRQPDDEIRALRKASARRGGGLVRRHRRSETRPGCSASSTAARSTCGSGFIRHTQEAGYGTVKGCAGRARNWPRSSSRSAGGADAGAAHAERRRFRRRDSVRPTAFRYPAGEDRDAHARLAERIRSGDWGRSVPVRLVAAALRRFTGETLSPNALSPRPTTNRRPKARAMVEQARRFGASTPSPTLRIRCGR